MSALLFNMQIRNCNRSYTCGAVYIKDAPTEMLRPISDHKFCKALLKPILADSDLI